MFVNKTQNTNVLTSEVERNWIIFFLQINEKKIRFSKTVFVFVFFFLQILKLVNSFLFIFGIKKKTKDRKKWIKEFFSCLSVGICAERSSQNCIRSYLGIRRQIVKTNKNNKIFKIKTCSLCLIETHVYKHLPNEVKKKKHSTENK